MSDTTAASDPRPKTLRKDVEYACEAATVIALGISIELNVYDHLHNGHISPLIAWTIGIAVPALVAILSHAAAHVNFHWAVKGWIGVIVAVLMYVSASAGTRVLTPGMTHGPAVATAFGMDLAALTALGTLMYSASQKAALAKWEARQEARRRQAELDVLDAQYTRPRRQGNTGGNGEENVPGNGRGNAPALPEGNAGRLALPAASPAPGEGPAASRGQEGDAEVYQIRRPAQAPEEIRQLAWKLAGELALQGKTLSVAAYKQRYGGKTERISPIIAEVKDQFAARHAAAGE